MPTLTFTDSLVTDICCTCGIRFAVPADFNERRRKDGNWYYCPSGHHQRYTPGETEADRLRKDLVRVQARLDQEKKATEEEHKMRVAAQRSVIAQKANNTKLKKKLATGTCPCCERLFPDLAAHMANDHPDFEGREEPTETPLPE